MSPDRHFNRITDRDDAFPAPHPLASYWMDLAGRIQTHRIARSAGARSDTMDGAFVSCNGGLKTHLANICRPKHIAVARELIGIAGDPSYRSKQAIAFG